jgi:predicted nucleotidyltransferase
MNNINISTETILNTFASAVKTAVPDVIFVYLFGSYAWGEPTPESDFDFMVVIPNEITGDEEFEIILKIDKLLEKNDISIEYDFLVRSKERFDRRITAPTIEREVYRKGILLYERE